MTFHVCIGIIFFIATSSAEKAPYTSFAKEATSALSIEYYDYIIVGGGTTGCSLAATLSTSAKIVLLERGGLPYDNPHVTHISGTPFLFADISPTSPAQLFISTDGVYNHRARILGGGSAINAGFYSRANPEYVQEIGLDEQLMKESYEWVERKLVFKPQIKAWQTGVRDGLLEAGVLPNRGTTYEHLIGTKIGGTIFDQNGNRHTAADLLEYADPTNIIVYLHANVHQILFNTSTGQRPKAYGVVFKDSKGSNHMAYSKNEVILSAGAIGSPQLLMLSGVGPTDQLKAHGIQVILDQPMVGQGMSDNPMNAILIPSPRPVEISLAQAVGISDVGSYIEAGSGFVQLSFLKTLAQNYARIANQTILPFPIPGVNDIFQNPNAPVGVIAEKVRGPFSTGHMEIKSLDPNDNPKVTFNYFQDPRDIQRCVEGLKILKGIVESRAFSSFQYPFTSFEAFLKLVVAIPNNLRKRHLTTAYSLEQYCTDTVMTIWHYHGGCQVDKVVDRYYKVIGVDALRVVDGSTFSESPGTNPQATIMMLGRYMGQKILQDQIYK